MKTNEQLNKSAKTLFDLIIANWCSNGNKLNQYSIDAIINDFRAIQADASTSCVPPAGYYVDAIKKYLDGDYSSIKKSEKCDHGFYGFECCEACIDEYFISVLAATPKPEKVSISTGLEHKNSPAVDECKVYNTSERKLVSEPENTVDVQKLAEETTDLLDECLKTFVMSRFGAGVKTVIDKQKADVIIAAAIRKALGEV